MGFAICDLQFAIAIRSGSENGSGEQQNIDQIPAADAGGG